MAVLLYVMGATTFFVIFALLMVLGLLVTLVAVGTARIGESESEPEPRHTHHRPIWK